MSRVGFTFLFLCFTFLSALGQDNFVHLIENKGQWPDVVIASADLTNGKFYLEKTGFTYDFQDEKTIALKSQAHIGQIPQSAVPDRLKCHAVKVNFEGAQIPKVIKKQLVAPTRYNYFLGNQPENWVSDARAYASYVLTDLYPNIDLNLYSQDLSLKYDLVVHPGGNPEAIKLNYRGADQLALRNQNLVVQTSINYWQELKPYAYQEIDKKKVAISCQYSIKKNVVSFELGAYNPRLPLVIDPILVISTYSGSAINNFGYTATYDSYGFLYSGSSALGGDGYPTTTGAYDVSYNGGNSDVAITKYDTTGTFRVYSTIIGGDNSELPHSLVLDSKNQLILFGTTSSANFPTSEKALDKTFAGGPTVNLAQGLGVSYTNGADIFVCKFSPDGDALLASTFLGGSGNDGINIDLAPGQSKKGLHYNYADEIRGEVIVDDLDNCYIVTTTNSADIAYIPATSIQPINAGKMDGIIFKLDYSLNQLLWATYLGGTGNDAIYAIDIDPKGEVVVSGGTISTDLSVTPNAVQSTFGGGRADGFLAVMPSTGDSLQTLTYWGSSAYDQIYLHEFGPDDNLYLFGQTEDNTGKFNFSHTGFGQPNSGQFITKINNRGDSLHFSLTFGNGIPKPNLSPTAFLVDNCGNIYTTGWGGLINMNIDNFVENNAQNCAGLPTTVETNPFFRQATDGNDFHIMVLNDNAAALVTGFYFGENGGQDHVDGGTSRFDKKSQIYHSVCASCGGSQNFPKTPGAVSSSNNSSCNNAVFKIDFQTQGVAADFSWTVASCMNDSIVFDNRSFAGTEFIWDFGDGSPTSTVASPKHLYPLPGVYFVKLFAQNPITCNGSDSIVKRVVIYPIGKHQRPDTLVCLSDTLQLGFNAYPGASYDWTPGTGLSDSTAADPFFFPAQISEYQLITNAYGCLDTTIIKTSVDGVAASFINTGSLCSTDSVFFINNSVSADQYLWTFGDGAISTTANPSHKYAEPGFYQVKLYSTTFDPGPVCQPVDSMVRTLYVYPNGVHYLPDTLLCRSDTVQIGYEPLPGATYKWTPSTGLSNSNIANPLLVPKEANNYRLVISAGGCHDTTFLNITVAGVLADFTSNAGVCEDAPLSFVNKSISADSYLWDFGDGSQSTAANETHSFPEGGLYKVTLVSRTNNTSGNCPAVDSIQRDIRVYPTGFLQLPDTTICRNDTIQLGTLPIPGATYLWKPSNGLSNPNISNPILSPDSTRTYTLYTSALNCRDTVQIHIEVKGVSAGFNHTTTVCQNDSMAFFNRSIGANSYLWRFGDGTTSTATNPVHGFPGAGEYNVTLISSTILPDIPCPAIDSITQTVFVYPAGTLNLPDTLICRNDSTQIGFDPIPGATYSWSPSVGLSDPNISNPIVYPDSVINYTLTTSAFGCLHQAKVKITPRGVRADFDFSNSLCDDDSVRFNNLSLGASSFKWDFDDGDFSTAFSTKHVFPSVGTYNVKLIVKATSGTAPCPSSDTIVKTITIHPNGLLLLPDTTICLGDSLQFGFPPLPGTTYFWTPSTGISDPTISNPIIFPPDTLTYTLLAVAGSCVDSTVIKVNTAGVLAQFSSSQRTCQNDTLFFFNQSAGAQQYAWHFGDDSTSTDTNTFHVYQKPGIYQVKLVAKTLQSGKCPAADSIINQVIVYPAGTPPAFDTTVCVGDTLAVGITPLPDAIYDWSPGSGLSDSTIANPLLIGDSTRTYVLTSTAFGCVFTDTLKIITNGLKANFSTNVDVCNGDTVFFTNTSKYANTFNWFFSDGTQNQDTNTFHVFPTFGTFYAKLIASTQSNTGTCPNKDTLKLPVYVYPDGIRLLPNTSFCPDTVFTLGLDSIPGATYSWSPTLGLNNSSWANPLFSLKTQTTYTLITTKGKCYDSLSVTIDPILFDLLPSSEDTLLCDTTVTIKLTADGKGTINSFIWSDSPNFGTIPLSTDSFVTVTPANFATYYVRGFRNDCAFTDSIQVIILNNDTVLLDSIQSICLGQTALIGISSINNAGILYSWTPTLGLSDSTISRPYAQPTDTTTYELKIEMPGCFGYMNFTINVDHIELIAPDSIFWCDSLNSLKLVADGLGRVSNFYWGLDTTFNPLLNTNTLDSTATVQPPAGDFLYVVKGETSMCQFIDTVVISSDFISLGIDKNKLYCTTGPVLLDADNMGSPLTYEWQPASRIPGSNTTEQVLAYIQGTETFYLTATNPDGCQLTDTITVSPSQLLDLQAQIIASDSLFFQGRPVTVSANPQGGYSYLWQPAGIFPDPTSPVNSIYHQDSITIYLTITDGQCVVGASAHFYFKEIVCGPPDIYVPNAFTPNTDRTNDLMFVRGNYIESLYFTIYDRWGEKVFETRDQKLGWDGVYKGKMLDPAVFVYYLEATCKDQQKYFEKGNITLIR